jgi:hypothetical protein
MTSSTRLERSDRPDPDLTLLPRDPWPNQIQYLLLAFQAKQSLERCEKSFESNLHDLH